MFIATSAQLKIFAPLGAKPGSETIGEQAKTVALLRSFGVKEGPTGYKHLAPLGRNDFPTSIRQLSVCDGRW